MPISLKTIKKNSKYYTEKDTAFKFLLGGIGTGSISVGSRGELCDFEIFNKPNKNVILPYSFFSLFSRFDGCDKGEVRILEAGLQPPYTRPLGYSAFELAGVPRFKHAKLCGKGPFIEVELTDDRLPLKVKYTAFSPLIPLDEDNSGIPSIIFNFEAENTSDTPCDISVCSSVTNFCSNRGIDFFGNLIVGDGLKNEFYKDKTGCGILFGSEQANQNDKHLGTMCLSTANADATVKPEWFNGGWWDGAHDFFDEFSAEGKLRMTSVPRPDTGSRIGHAGRLKTGSLSAGGRILPKEKKNFSFVLSWHFPNRPASWEGHICPERDYGEETVKNYYAYKFKDARAVNDYVLKNYDYLYGGSKRFTDALFSTTVDPAVIDAINGTLPVLRSTTCFRVGSEGRFLCWEGCFDLRGSCEGNCTHVWNYAQTAAYLFPRLEQDMRRTEFLLETDGEGKMAFRTAQVFGNEKWDMIPAADGQMGCIVRLYRDWKLSGDDRLLNDCYEKMKAALDFAFSYWDKNGDCVLDSEQHNTYDIEFFGENSLTNSMFLAALLAGAKMAEYKGDTAASERWRAAFRQGSAKTDGLLYKNGYYVQALDDADKMKYQYGGGCLSDQIFGQTLAHLCGLGYILPKEHIKSAALSIYRNNFRKDLSEHFSVQRTYALNDESGLLNCSWPKGVKRPRFPFIYADELWTGVEYQVATNLIYEGFVEEGLDIVRAVRKRHNGKNRNPFNEVECGNHYARSLASYGLLVALSGFGYDLTRKEISFDPPAGAQNFLSFFCCAKGFGLYSQKLIKGKIVKKIEILSGGGSDLRLADDIVNSTDCF